MSPNKERPARSFGRRHTADHQEARWGKAVLVIDDEVAVRELLRKLLAGLGYEVCAVAGLEEARLAIVGLDETPTVRLWSLLILT